MYLDEDVSIDERGQRSGVMHSCNIRACRIGLLGNMRVVAMSHSGLTFDTVTSLQPGAPRMH